MRHVLRLGDLVVGRRVVVRHRLADGSASDALGDLVRADAEHLVVVTRRGEVTIALADVLAAKGVPPARTRQADAPAGAPRVGVEELEPSPPVDVAGAAGRAAVDLNADLGEGFGRWSLTDDSALLDVVTSANVACGFHAGDPATMLATCSAAAARGVAVGAHPAYRDLAGFGRRHLDASREELVGDVLYQLGALAGIARAAGTTVSYVKPHGALYTTAAAGGEHAQAVVEAVLRFDPGLPVVGLAGSLFLVVAREAGLRAVPEAFADRGYTAGGQLVDRRARGALVTEPGQVAERVVRLVRYGVVRSVDGDDVAVHAESVGVHGDSPGAVATAVAVRAALEAEGLAVRPFTGP